MAKTAKQLTPRQIAARKNGSKGGKARAQNLSEDRLKEIAQLGGMQTRKKYGNDYFSFIVSRRKRVGRYRMEVAEA